MTDEMITHPLTVDDWQTVDAVLDNLGAVERVGGDEAVAAQADRLREVGWAANHVHPHRGAGFGGWPAEDDVLPISLSRDDWAFARDAIDDAIVVARALSDDARSPEQREEWLKDARELAELLARLP